VVVVTVVLLGFAAATTALRNFTLSANDEVVLVLGVCSVAGTLAAALGRLGRSTTGDCDRHGPPTEEYVATRDTTAAERDR